MSEVRFYYIELAYIALLVIFYVATSVFLPFLTLADQHTLAFFIGKKSSFHCLSLLFQLCYPVQREIKFKIVTIEFASSQIQQLTLIYYPPWYVILFHLFIYLILILGDILGSYSRRYSFDVKLVPWIPIYTSETIREIRWQLDWTLSNEKR